MPNLRSTNSLATLNREGWALESAEARHAEAPNTFWIPSRTDRDAIAVGKLAQLLFQIAIPDDPKGEFNVERMWVEVKGRVDGTYVATLRNQPASVDSEGILDVGDKVLFRAEHVIDIRDESSDTHK